MRQALLLLLVISLAAQEPSSSGGAKGTSEMPRIAVEKIAGGFGFTEGPVFSPENYLLFSDVPGDKIWKLDPKGRTVFREASNGANGNAIDPEGRLYSCESKARRITRTAKDGKIEVLADQFEGKRFNAPNDIAVRKDHHVYFTDPAFGSQVEGRDLDFYGIYHLPPRGALELIAKTQGRPNGVALSPKGNLLYVADSDERIIRVFDIAGNGKASNMRTFISGIDGPPDGLRTDDKGNLWVACNTVSQYSPEGKFLQKIDIPETPRNLTFAPDDFQTIYVTALKSIYRIRLNAKEPVQH